MRVYGTMRATAVSVALLIGAAAQADAAPIANGSFENGFAGWDAIGRAFVITGDIAPTDGSYHVLMDTAGQPHVPFDSTGATRGDILGFFGVASGLDGFVEGSAVSQAINVSAGQTLLFDFNFLSAEGADPLPANDAAFLFADGQFFKLADVLTAAFGPADPLDGMAATGYQPFGYTFTTGGPQTIGFAVMDSGDVFVKSELLVDNVRVQIDAPATLPVLVAALAMAGRFRRRRPPA